jgi:hypothetical protein
MALEPLQILQRYLDDQIPNVLLLPRSTNLAFRVGLNYLPTVNTTKVPA